MIVLSLLHIFLISNWDVEYHDTNNIYCGASNYGPILLDCEWPKGSNHKYIFGAGIWVGTLLPDTCVSVGFNPNNGTDEFVPGLCLQGTTAYHNPYVQVYIYPEHWPPPLDTFPMAPDTTLTDEDSWACFNDNDPYYHDSVDTHPIGIELYQSGYTDISCPNAIFFRYTIKNCTTYTITNAYIGICIDYDIGNDDDDMYRLIYDRWFPDNPKTDSFYIDYLPYGYDSDWQEPGWNKVGVVGLYMLETPNNKGPTASMWFTIDNDPQKDFQRYLTLKGINYQNGESLGFMIDDTLPGDKRLLFSTGPFTLDAGDTTHFAFVAATANDTLTLPWEMKEARQLYYQQVGIEEAEGKNRFQNDPISTITNGVIYVGKNDHIEIFDPLGRVIKRITSPPEILSLNYLPSGVYFLKLKQGSEFRIEKILIIR